MIEAPGQSGRVWVFMGGGFGVHFRLPVSPEILAEVSALDRFLGRWSTAQSVPAERLRLIEREARAHSAAASCRIAGLQVSDADAWSLLEGRNTSITGAEEVLGYARALNRELPPDGTLLGGDLLRALHAEMLGLGDSALSPWREGTLHREGFDAEGRATGYVFSTLPARYAQQKTEELTTWLEIELRNRGQHPALVIGAFLLCFLSISPFERANGRMSRLLAHLLLRRAGYGFLPYASLDSKMEASRHDYWDAVSRSQTHLWTEEADLEPWLSFFLGVLGRHRSDVEARIAAELRVQDFPPLQRAILEAVHEHGSVDAALLIQETGANRNTLKDNLRRLVRGGVIEKIGERRATRYRLPGAGRPGGPGVVGPKL